MEDGFPIKTSLKNIGNHRGFPSQPWQWLLVRVARPGGSSPLPQKSVMSIVIVYYLGMESVSNVTQSTRTCWSIVYASIWIPTIIQYIYTYYKMIIKYCCYHLVLYQNYAHKIFGLCHLLLVGIMWNSRMPTHVPTWPWDPSAELALLASC